MFLQLKIIQLLCASYLFFHPIHVSITNMDYDEKNQEVTFSTKIFKDDFQLLFGHLNEINIDFEDQDSINKYSQIIYRYCLKSLKIELNDENQECQIDKVEVKDDAVWLSGRFKITEPIKSIKIINTLLLDLYFDQKNLLIFQFKDKEYAYQFNIKNTEFNFDAH